MLHICNFSSCLETSQRFVYLIGLYKEPGFGFGYEHFFLAARAFTAVCGPYLVLVNGDCSLLVGHKLSCGPTAVGSKCRVPPQAPPLPIPHPSQHTFYQ